MSDLRQAAQQALEALEPDCELAEWHVNELREKAITALKQALAEPEQEPVAWVDPKWVDPDTRGWPSDSFEALPIEGWLPLYTAPTPRKPLTDDEIALIVGECAASAYQHDDFSFARAIERAHGIGEQHGS